MILINLLPHREERRRRRKSAYFAGLGVAAAGRRSRSSASGTSVLQQLIVGAAGAQRVPAAPRSRSSTSQIKDIASLQAEIESLKARQKAVEDLQTDRNVPVHLLNELVKQTPEGVYLTVDQAGRPDR